MSHSIKPSFSYRSLIDSGRVGEKDGQVLSETECNDPDFNFRVPRVNVLCFPSDMVSPCF